MLRDLMSDYSTCSETTGEGSRKAKALGSKLQVPFSCDAKPGSMVASLPILTDSSRSSVCVQVLPRRGLRRVTTASWSVARQTLPRHRSPCMARHRRFTARMAIDAVKSVSFEEKKTVLDLKLVYKMC